MVDRSLALDLELFSRGGLAILDAIERQDYDVLTRRPVISKPRKLWLVARAASGKTAVSDSPLQLRAAYSVCRHIARSAAKNFYYGFLVLPATQARRDLCGLRLHAPRRRYLRRSLRCRWNSAARSWTSGSMACARVVEGSKTDDPVLLALADSQKRFNIPLELLEKLVHGTAMDVAPGSCQSCSTRPSISSTITATTWRPSLVWSAFESSAIAIRERRSWPSVRESPSSSPTFFAM